MGAVDDRKPMPTLAELEEWLALLEEGNAVTVATAREGWERTILALMKMREVLEVARHALTTLHGLTASDGLGAYHEAQAEGCDANGAWDCFVARTFRIDETETLTMIDNLLGEEEHHD